MKTMTRMLMTLICLLLVNFLSGALGAPTWVKRQEASPTSSSLPSPSNTGSSDNGNNGGSGQTPFLFFIALGLGIVFTNLWVILGLRYCCRQRRQREALENAIRNGEVDETTLNHHAEEMAMYLSPMYGPALPSYRLRFDRRLVDKTYLDTIAPVQKYHEWTLSKGGGKGGISRSAAAAVAECRIESAKNNDDHSDDEHHEHHEHHDLNFDHADNGILNDDHSANHISSNVNDNINPNGANEDNDNGNDNNANGNGNENVHEYDDDNNGDDTGNECSDRRDSACSDYSESSDRGEIHIYESPDNDENDHDGVGEKQKEKHLHITEVTPIDINDSGDMCSICLEEIDPDDDVRGLPCSHVFHAPCVTRWLTTRKGSCPLCKKDLCPRPVMPPRARRDTRQGQGRHHIDDGHAANEPQTGQGQETQTAEAQSTAHTTETTQNENNDTEAQQNQQARPSGLIPRCRHAIVRWWLADPGSRVPYSNPALVYPR
uniref:ARAD1A17996p n=1 Tax=Blastobotrys adeninivorans TaxID=409370 RepID=A0A060SYM0_BLAAD